MGVEVNKRYAASACRETLGSVNFVAILDLQTNERIAFIPFDRRHPPLDQPDVKLIVDSLNRNIPNG